MTYMGHLSYIGSSYMVVRYELNMFLSGKCQADRQGPWASSFPQSYMYAVLFNVFLFCFQLIIFSLVLNTYFNIVPSSVLRFTTHLYSQRIRISIVFKYIYTHTCTSYLEKGLEGGGGLTLLLSPSSHSVTMP